MDKILQTIIEFNMKHNKYIERFQLKKKGKHALNHNETDKRNLIESTLNANTVQEPVKPIELPKSANPVSKPTHLRKGSQLNGTSSSSLALDTSSKVKASPQSPTPSKISHIPSVSRKPLQA